MAAFFEALEPLAADMLGKISSEAMTSTNIYNSALQYEKASSSQTSSQNFLAGQNQLNRQTAINQQQTQINANQSLQDSRFNNLNTLQSQRLQTSQTMQGNSIASSFARGALNLGGGLISSGLQFALNNQIASLQRQNFDFMTNKASDAFTNAGLPSWMAYTQNSGMMNTLPRTAQVFNGQNMMSSSIPGNPLSQAWTGSESQSAFGFGDVPLAN